ncbi:MAG: tetratricopeptide repeat protein [Pyrinomonadaceae bacterium]
MSSPAPSLYVRAAAVLVMLTSALGGVLPAQDITSNSGVFVSRPANPPVRRGPKRSQAPAGARKDEATVVQPAAPKSVQDEAVGRRARITARPSEEDRLAYSPNDFSQEVENALARGNGARDSDPPRYQEAEHQYRLALKLDPDDPRPHVGLANIYYDQKQFEQSAAEYRAAMSVRDKNRLAKFVAEGAGIDPAEVEVYSPPAPPAKAQGGGQQKGSPPPKPHEDVPRLPHKRANNPSPGGGRPRSVEHLQYYASRSYRLSGPEGQLQFYLASSLLRAGRDEEAARILDRIKPGDTQDPAWYATLAYYLAARGRYEEGSEQIAKAVALAPDVAAYKEFSQTLRARQAEAVPLSAETEKKLEGTEWHLKDLDDGAHCELSKGGMVRCQSKHELSVAPRKGRWKAEGELVHVYGGSRGGFETHCVGTLKGAQLVFKCSRPDDFFYGVPVAWDKR